jgi:hypothetical protein
MISSFISTVVVIAITAALAGLYLLPLLLGWARHVPDLAAIAVINILLGWSLVGWVVALALALRSVVQAAPAVQVFQQLPQAPSPHQPGAAWPAPPIPGPPAPPPGPPEAAPPWIIPPRHDEPQPPEDDGQQW